MVKETRGDSAPTGPGRLCQQVEKILKIVDKGLSIALVGEAGHFNTVEVVRILKEKRDVAEICAEECDRLDETVRQCIEVISNDEFAVAEGQLTKMGEYAIELKTKDMESRFEIGKTIYDELRREKASVGDVVKIYKECGFVTRVGRAMVIDNTNVVEELVEIPVGDCFKKEVVKTRLTLAQVDAINCKRKDLEGLYATKQAPRDVRDDVDQQITRWSKEKKITIETRLILVRNSEMLTREQIDRILATKRVAKLSFVFLCNKSMKTGLLRIRVDNTTAEEAQRWFVKHLKTSKIKIEKNTQEKLLYRINESNLQNAIEFVRLVQEDGTLLDEAVDRFLACCLL